MASTTHPQSSGATRALYEIVQTAAGMSGVFLVRRSGLRTAVSLMIGLSAAALLSSQSLVKMHTALLLFGGVSLLRHAFLFASFGPRGIAPRLKARLGCERGFAVYEAAAAVSLYLQRLAFFLVLLAPSRFAAAIPAGLVVNAVLAAGVVLLGVGLSVSVAATRRVGLDTYYYRDLFMGPRHVNLECEGVYASGANPIYGLGQLAAYGAALIALSPEGVLVAAVNQAVLFTFNLRVEQPHLRDAMRLSLEQDLRQNLARTLVEPAAVAHNDGQRADSRRRTVPPPRPRARVSVPAPDPIEVDVVPDSRAA